MSTLDGFVIWDSSIGFGGMGMECTNLGYSIFSCYGEVTTRGTSGIFSMSYSSIFSSMLNLLESLSSTFFCFGFQVFVTDFCLIIHLT